jgi:hypothetical protein
MSSRGIVGEDRADHEQRRAPADDASEIQLIWQ